MTGNSKIIFLSYINRSGSTYLLNLLSKIKGIFVCPEANILYDLFLKHPLTSNNCSASFNKKFHHAINYDIQLKYWKIDQYFKDGKMPEGENNLCKFLDILEKCKESFNPTAKYIVYKHNNLFTLINKVPEPFKKRIFFLSLIRDPRGIFVSQKTTISPYTKKTINNNPLLLAYSWNDMVNFSNKSKNKNLMLLKYEDLVQNQSKILGAIIHQLLKHEFIYETDFCNWIENRLPFVERSMHPSIMKNPQMGNINKWLNQINPVDLSLIEHITRKNLLHFKYSVKKPQLNFFVYFFFYVKYKLRLLLSIDHY